MTFDSKCQSFPVINGCVCDVRLLRVLFRYAYILYEDEKTAKSVAQEFTEDPPVFLKSALDVKLYREPKEVPKGR